MVMFNQHERFYNTFINCFSHIMVKSRLYMTLIINYFSITMFCMQNTVDFL